MDLLTAEDFENLIEKSADWCVSIYQPTHRSLPEARQDPIRFKGLVRDVESELAARGLRAPAIAEPLQQAQHLLDDPLFWRHQADGLVVFLTAGEFQTYRLPIGFSELAVVSERFHLKPLLPLLTSDDRFYVLALSKNDVRLIAGTRYGASEIEVKGMPASIKDILGTYDFEAQLQFHTRAQRAGGGERAAVFHGQGGGTDDIKPRLMEYFRQINEGVHARLKNEGAPLVLAGVESLFPLYREVNSYDQLTGKGIKGNPELLSPEDLRQRAWEIVEPHFLRERHEAEDRYRALAGTGRTSNDLKEVVTAVHDGRIEALFVAVGVQLWGNFDKESRSIAIHEQAEAGDRDLLDICAVRTFMNGGKVYAVEPKAVPGDELVAAVFRY